MLKGLDVAISQETKIPVRKADDPLTCVVRGTGMIIEDLNSFSDVLLDPTNS